MSFKRIAIGPAQRGHEAERRAIKLMGARKQKRSGGLPGFPADFFKEKWLGENKSTEGQILHVQKRWLQKIESQAVRHNKRPMVSMQFCRKGTVVVEDLIWIAMPLWLFKQLGGWEK